MKYCWKIARLKTNIIIDQLLINRDISLNKRDIFLNPNFDKDLEDPFLLKDMNKAIELIWQAKNKKNKIGIFADYDADGVPGAAILAKTFEYLNINYEVYIPSRNEGYGLNKKGIDFFVSEGVNLMITVDLGITGKNEVNYAIKNKLKVIITDHHEIQNDLYPKNANAVIHTSLSDEYNNKFLCGAAVVYKVAIALMKRYKKPNIKQIKWMLDLVAISTVCDMEPLVNENRTLVKYGLIVLKKTKNIGLKELYKFAEINNELINTYTIGYQIGPRINALGRMKNAKKSYNLLTTKNESLAKKYAKEINDANTLRKNALDLAVKQADKQIIKNNLDKEKIICVKGKWHIGIVGLIASRLLEKYNRPIVAFTKEGGILRGSARSIDEYNLLKALEKTNKYLLTLGGHEKACGLSLKENNYRDFYKLLVKNANATIKDEYLIKKIKIDCLLEFDLINKKLYKSLLKLEPFGLGNPKPVFVTKNVYVTELRYIGSKKNHIKMQLSKNNVNFNALYFNCSNNEKIKRGCKIDVVYYLDENTWNGKTSIQLNIIDYKNNNYEY